MMRYNDLDSLQKKEFIESMTIMVENGGGVDAALEQQFILICK